MQLRNIAKNHPGETAFSLYAKQQKGRPKSGTKEALSRKHSGVRKKQFRTRDIVEVQTVDEERKSASDRGSKFFCKRCLG